MRIQTCLSCGLRLLGISIIAFGVLACQEKRRNEGSTLIGDIDLSPKIVPSNLVPQPMTLRELNIVLRSQHELHTKTVKNQITAGWWWDLVTAYFYVPEREPSRTLSLDDRPYMIEVRTPFKGSIWGVHIGDSSNEVISNLEKKIGYKLGEITTRHTGVDNKTDHKVDIDKTWIFCWKDDQSQTVVEMCLRNKGYRFS